ncbi:MAG: TetR/AcrR family transcriptional regulator, partial [Candidatus Sulfotelmatobacter sp.]
MSGIASNPIAPPRYMRQHAPRPRSEAKRSRIIDAAMQHFAENGYNAARVGDIAAALGIAKGSVFQHFGSKDGLFFEVYKRAVRSFSKYLDAPAD